MANKDNKVRLQKVIADAGIASRRKSEELISNGSVKVNGRIAHIGDKVDPYNDKIVVNGKKVEVRGNSHYYIMLYKPRGFVTTMSDEKGRKCVAELVSDIPARLYPVGRLDRDSEGLLLMTNDGAFANLTMHPSMHISKTYRVTVRSKVTEEQLNSLCAGVMLDDKMTLPAEVKVIISQPERTVMEFIIHEGRNRQIRRMCESVGLEVIRLKRIAIGPVKLGMLQPGKWRELNADEMKKLASVRKQAKDKENSNK